MSWRIGRLAGVKLTLPNNCRISAVDPKPTPAACSRYAEPTGQRKVQLSRRHNPGKRAAVGADWPKMDSQCPVFLPKADLMPALLLGAPAADRLVKRNAFRVREPKRDNRGKAMRTCSRERLLAG